MMSSSSNASMTASAEPLPAKTSLKLAELRSRVLIGELPEDFLRIPIASAATAEQQQAQQQSSVAQQQQQQQVVVGPGPQQQYLHVNPAEHFYSFVPPHTRGRIAVKIVEAKLTKNYGLPGVRMDPYVRMRIGNTLFETPTCVNGGKTPHWNRTVNAYLPDGVESVYLQIFDERAFTSDECVAWAHLLLPQGIFSQEVIDEWYQLSGPQGADKEGVINLVISFTPVAQQPQSGAVATPDDQLQQAADELGALTVDVEPTPFTEAELDELHEVFPTIDKEVIRSVMEANGGNKGATVNSLLQMTD